MEGARVTRASFSWMCVVLNVPYMHTREVARCICSWERGRRVSQEGQKLRAITGREPRKPSRASRQRAVCVRWPATGCFVNAFLLTFAPISTFFDSNPVFMFHLLSNEGPRLDNSPNSSSPTRQRHRLTPKQKMAIIILRVHERVPYTLRGCSHRI
jgi:hypothetical protein